MALSIIHCGERMDNDKIFVDFNTMSFGDWVKGHKDHRRQYQETSDGNRRFRFVRCVDCGVMYYLGEYQTLRR